MPAFYRVHYQAIAAADGKPISCGLEWFRELRAANAAMLDWCLSPKDPGLKAPFADIRRIEIDTRIPALRAFLNHYCTILPPED